MRHGCGFMMRLWPLTLFGVRSPPTATLPVSLNASHSDRPIPVRAYDPRWEESFVHVRNLVANALGTDHTVRHVGSTAVLDMVAEPVIDADLLVPDVLDEHTWSPQLEAVGFRLIFRDVIAGDPHRQLTLGDPNTNLHVWQPEAVEPQRHRLFVEWLRSHPEDQQAYADAKAQAAYSDEGVRYNDAKAAAVYDIYERAFAEPRHTHHPHPRPRPRPRP